MNTVFFRADANAQIGGGHMMRCLTIAEAIRDEPPASTEPSYYTPDTPAVVFVCADEESADLPRKAHFETIVLGTDYREMEAELPAMLSAPGLPPASTDDDSASLYCAGHSAEPDTHIASRNGAHDAPVSAPWRTSRSAENMRPSGAADDSPATIVVDSYFATDAYLKALREHARVVLIEDALTHARPADVVINYNLTADAEAYRAAYAEYAKAAETDARHAVYDAHAGTADAGDAPQPVHPLSPLLLIGPAYVPLRPQFADRSVTIRDTVRHILILSGASDAHDAAIQIYRTLAEGLSGQGVRSSRDDAGQGVRSSRDAAGQDAVHFHIVCGAFYKNKDALERAAANDPRLHIHREVKDMAALMCEMDLCVSAGGSTLYELCATGLPFVTYSVADNQRLQCTVFDTKKIAPCAGAFDLDAADTLRRILSAVQQLCDDRALRTSRHALQQTVADAHGAARIAEALTSAEAL